MVSFPGQPNLGKPAPERQNHLDFNEARDDGWQWQLSDVQMIRAWSTMHGSFAPRSRQITTPAPHYSIFYRPDALPNAQLTVSKH